MDGQFGMDELPDLAMKWANTFLEDDDVKGTVHCE